MTKPKEKADDWIIILDHSIQLGNDKILVIFGIREKDIDFSRPLKLQDLVPLREISRKKWTGKIIKPILDDLQEELGCIQYAVSDEGSDIKKGLELANIPKIDDITHSIASILRKIYEKDIFFDDFTKKISKMRLKLAQSHLAYLIPTVQRKKGRYQNIKSLSDWGINLLRYLNKAKGLTKDDREKISWIKDYSDYILEMAKINQTINAVEKKIKHNGLTKSNVQYCMDKLNRLKGERGKYLRNQLGEYFLKHLYVIPNKQKILCVSDIIESAFGKYKNYVSSNPMAGITNLVLCIAAFTCKLSNEEIKEALEKTRIKDVKIWTQKNIGETLLNKRRKAFKKDKKVEGSLKMAS